MRPTIITILAFICFIVTNGQNSLKVDFRYAPDWHATSICLPDDTSKTLIGPEGQLLYDFGGKKFFAYANGEGFKTVFHILADEGMKFDSQKLYSPKVPIVETTATLDGLKIKQEAFAYSSAGLGYFGKKQNWQERKTAPREDIILTHISNNTNEIRIFNPMVVVNSEFKVSLDSSIITVNEDHHLFMSHQVKRVRQNLGEEKTLVEFSPTLLQPGETILFAAIYDNGKTSELAQQLKESPDKVIIELQKIRTDIINYWENNSPVPFGHISIPDQGIQDLIDASLRNIWQAREILDGKYSFQVGPTCYRGLWIVDGSFLLETSAMVDKGSDARDGIEYMLSFQQPNGKFGKLNPTFWKENGIVLWTCVRHAMLTQDKDWLRSIWPQLRKTVGFIKEMRKMTLENDILLDDGLIPPGEIDGGLGGGKDKGEYTNIYWNLLGFKAIVQAAEWIGENDDAREWQREYDDFYATFQKAAHRDMVTDTYGNRYLPIPMDPKYHSLPQRAQWAFCQGVYPGQLFSQNDPIAKGTMDMLHTTLQEGMVMGTGWIIDGIWNYFAGFYGHACLWMGEGDRAVKSLYAFANHASHLLAWREEHNPRDLPRHFVGDMPHNWASAEFIRLAVHLLAIDRGNELHLFEGLPKEWVQAGMETSLKDIATPFGKLSFNLKVDEDGKSAMLKIEPLSDPSCDKIVVHQKGWALDGEASIIELDPSKKQSIKIEIKQ
ncbi:hypothetical protein D1614_02590 [Maribellus luteus]|uniref:Alpha-L-rhamnosidase six-hairpin glycosidase domain-containing protein n=1 Tax=Maribellus luteus TaxID=2305463 RepID=A0A399T4U3_9BACT|nr:hypothetical protein [Maribellus luteus]RIJ50828.1 hypothetical protein D1614_02590 [Maribellus luteus]